MSKAFENVQKLRDLLNIKVFGAVGNGIVDDTAAIQAALATGKSVFFPSGHYIVKSLLEVSGDMVGEGAGKTKIEFINSFVNPYSDNRQYFALINKNYADMYNEATADVFTIYGIHFYVSQNNYAAMQGVIGLANTKGVSLTRNWVSSDSAGTQVRTCVTLFNANRNVVIENNYLENNTNIVGGGCLWIQGGPNGTGANASFNIVAQHNFIKQDRPVLSDEPVAIWHAQGDLSAVNFFQNTIHAINCGHALTVFTTASGSATTGTIKDIRINNNEIRATVQSNAIRIGGTNLPVTLNNVTVEGNAIETASSNASSSYGCRYIAGQNVQFFNNSITSSGSGTISRGIGGDATTFTCVGNIINGNFSIGIQNAMRAVNNTVTCNDIGIQNVLYSHGNAVTADLCFSVNLAGDYAAEENVFNARSAITTSTVLVTSTGTNVDFRNNVVNCANVNARSFTFTGTGRRTFVNNKILGTGRVVTGAVSYASGNWWFDRFDDLYSSPSLGVDFTTNYPLGHVIKNLSPVLDVNNMLLSGWQLYDASGTRTWAPLYLSTVSPAT